MFKKVYNSLAFRSASVYKTLLDVLPAKTGSKPRSAALKMISMCGEKHVSFLKQSLYSILKAFDEIPEIEIYTDGSSSTSALKEQLGGLLTYVKVSDWESCISEISPDEKKLVSFAHKHPIGRKLLVIAQNAKSGPTLWWDTDILWFKGLSKLNLPNAKNTFSIKSTEDYQPAYSENMLSSFPGHSEKPFINTGLVYLNGNLLESNDLTNLLEIASTEPDHFSEQTILARTVLKTGKNTWPLEQIACKQTDQLTLAATYTRQNWIARHYVGPVRHLFWRDAFFLKIGIKP